MNTTEFLSRAKPYILRWFEEIGGGAGPFAPSPHDLNSPNHTGSLADAQAPQFLKLDGTRDLIGNLGVSSGVTIDLVDIDVFKAAYDAHSHSLDAIANPVASKTFSVGASLLKFTYTTPSVGFEIEATGALTADLVKIHQNTGNPGAVDLVHLEASDPDVTMLRLEASTARPPFVLGANLQGQLVTGLRADEVNKSVFYGPGLSGGGLLTADITLSLNFAYSPTWTGLHTFNRVGAPFAIGASSSGLLVSGLNADQADSVHFVGTGYTLTVPATGTAALLGLANTFTLGPQTMQAGADANKALVAKAHSPTQSANIFEVQSSTGALLVAVGPTGRVGIGAAPNSAYSIRNSATFTADATAVGLYNYITQNTSGGTGYGIINSIRNTGTDNLSALFGATFAVSLEGTAANTVSTAIGGQFAVSIGASSLTNVTSAYAGQFNVSKGGAGGSITNAHGIYVYDITAGASNWAIRTYAGNIVFNESGDSATNFRVEGDTDANLLYTQASTDRVGVGLTTPAAKFDVRSTSEQLRLEYDATNYAAFTVGAGGNLTVAPSGDFLFDPTGNDILPVTGYDLNIGSLSKKYLTLHAAELWVETLVAQNTIATIGGRILVGPTTTLTSDLAPADTAIYVKHNEMTVGDTVYMEANGAVEFMAITSGPTGTGPYSYGVTRNLDGSGANQWYAGDAIFNTGQTGEGFIDIYSVRGVASASEAGPSIVGNVRGSATYNDWAEHWAIGNLNGLYGYGVNTYGVGLGKYSTTTNYLLIDPTNGLRFYGNNLLQAQFTGANLIFYANAVQTLALDGSTGSAIFGVVAAGKNNLAWDAVNDRLLIRRNTTLVMNVKGDDYLKFGSDVSAVATTVITIASSDITYNGESLGAGDLLLGDNSASKANLLWDKSAGKLQLRGGTTMQAEIGTDGRLTAGGGAVGMGASGLEVLIQSTLPVKSDAKAVGFVDSLGGTRRAGLMVGEDTVLKVRYMVMSLDGSPDAGGSNEGFMGLSVVSGEASYTAALNLIADKYTAYIQAQSPIYLTELSAAPYTSYLDGSQGMMYVRNNKLVLAFDDGGTVRYKYLDLTGTGVTWVHTTSAP